MSDKPSYISALIAGAMIALTSAALAQPATSLDSVPAPDQESRKVGTTIKCPTIQTAGPCTGNAASTNQPAPARSPKTPTVKTLCLPPGETKPVAC